MLQLILIVCCIFAGIQSWKATTSPTARAGMLFLVAITLYTFGF